jgi:hypothetical protein
MKSFFFASFLTLSSFLAEANVTSKFGEVPMEELTMKSYARDTSAAAIILFDKGSTVLTSLQSGHLTYKRHVRIKIFRKEAFEDWVNVTLFSERGTFSKLQGITYNLEEESVIKSEIDDKTIFKTRFNKYIDEIRFTLPDVREGSVIEYSYIIKGEIGVSHWQFQYSIPVVFSEYTVEVPSFFNMNYTIKGLISPTYEIKNWTKKWVLTDIPAFKAEPFMPNEDDFVSSVKFSFSGSTWKAITERLWADENFGRTVTGIVPSASFLKKEAEKITAGLTNTRQKIIAIHQYVKDHLEWDGTEDIYAAANLKDNFKSKKGTAADINLAMASMLHKVGVRVEMVLLSTRGNGSVRTHYPSTRQFNYTICRAYGDTTEYLLDATEKYLPWNVLPERCLNGIGLSISEEKYSWINIESKAKARIVAGMDLILNANGVLQGKLTYNRSEYAANEMRKHFHKKGKERYVSDFVKKHQSWNILNSEFLNLEDNEKSVFEVHEISIEDHGITTDEFMYIDPFIIFKEDENPFKIEKRQFPIDFGVRTEKGYVTNIIIPDGYLVDEIPPAKLMVLPKNKGKFSYNVTQTGNRLTVVSNIQINERIFMQDEYPGLREFYNRIVAKQAEQIVLKKKG